MNKRILKNCRLSIFTSAAFIILNCAVSSCIAQRKNLLETGNFEAPNNQEATNPHRPNNQIIGPFTIERCDDLAVSTTCPPPTEVVSFVNDPAGGTQTGMSNDKIQYANEEFDLGSCAGDRGRWTEWVAQIKWTPENTGFIRLWKNGVQVIGGDAPAQWENRPTYYDITRCPGFKMGMYRGDPNWKGPNDMTLYGDDYRLGNSNATYNDVAPTPLK